MSDKLSSFKQGANTRNITIAPLGSELIDKRPKHALSAMLVISNFSWVESILMQVFMTLLGQNPGPAAAMYASLIGVAAQRSAFRALARECIDK